MANQDLIYQFNIHGIDVTIKNLDGLNRAIKITNDLLKQTAISSNEFSQRLETLRGLQVARTNLLSMNTGLGQTQTASANAAQALLNLNYVVRDSPYFFNNFALGVLAVGNNLNPLIDSFTRLRMEAGEKSITTMALLRQALVGGAGLSIAFSVVVSAIQAFIFWQSRAQSETSKTTKEVDKLKQALDKFVDVQFPSEKTVFNVDPEKLKAALQGAKDELAGIESQLTAIEMKKSYGSDTWNNNVEIATKEATKTKEELETTKKLLEEKIQIINKEIRAQEILKGLGLEESARQKEKTKELKKQVEYLEAGNAEIRRQIDMANRWDTRFGREAGTTESGAQLGGLFGTTPRASRDTKAQGERIKETTDSMKILGEVANQTGTLLAQAFMMGRFELDRLFQSLLATIAQMLILRGIMAAFSGGGGAIAMGSSPATSPLSFIPGIGWAFQKSAAQTVVIGGKLSMDSHKFVVDLRRIDNSYKANYEVGSGNIFNT